MMNREFIGVAVDVRPYKRMVLPKKKRRDQGTLTTTVQLTGENSYRVY